MVLLPIVDRELRVASRRAGTYWMRFWAAMLVMAISVVVLQSKAVPVPEMGQHLLNALGVLALGFSLSAGIFLTSDCLAEEKREGTIGLLFLTDLKSYDIVLGKLAANSVNAFFGFLAIFPILGLTLLMGGVTGWEFGRIILVCVVTMFFSLSVGMMVSAASHDAKSAIIRASLFVVIISGVFPAMWGLMSYVTKSKAFDFVTCPSPGYAYYMAFDVNYKASGGALRFWSSLGTVLVIALFGVMRASLILPRFSREERQSGPGRDWFKWLKWFGRGTGLRTGEERMRIITANPAYWLTVRDPAPKLQARKVFWLLLPFWAIFLVAMVKYPDEDELSLICFSILFGAHILIKVLMALEASRRLNHDCQSGGLELLLVTPMPVRVLLAGQKAALRAHFSEAFGVLAVSGVLLCATMIAFAKRLGFSHSEVPVFIGAVLGGLAMFVVDFHAIGWVAMWRGLKTRQHVRAAVMTICQVMGIPWLLIFFFIFASGGFNGANDAAWAIGFWFAIGLIVDVISAQLAMRKLAKNFRHTVLQRFHAKC